MSSKNIPKSDKGAYNISREEGKELPCDFNSLAKRLGTLVYDPKAAFTFPE